MSQQVPCFSVQNPAPYLPRRVNKNKRVKSFFSTRAMQLVFCSVPPSDGNIAMNMPLPSRWAMLKSDPKVSTVLDSSSKNQCTSLQPSLRTRTLGCHFSLHTPAAPPPPPKQRGAQGVNWVKVISRARLGRSSWVRPSMIPNRHLTERTHITGANQPAAKISLLHRFCLGLPTHILPSSQPFVSLKVQKSYNNCRNLNHNQDIFKVAQILQRSG